MLIIYLCQIVAMVLLIIFIFIHNQPEPKEEDFMDKFFYELALTDYEYDQKHSLNGIEFLIAIIVMLFIAGFMF